MKNFGFILIVFFSAILTTQASTYDVYPSNLKGPTLELQKELVQIVGDMNVGNYNLEDGLRFTVEFIVNDSGEIVVLKTSSELFDRTIKSKMNYHTVEADVKKNHKYILPITIKK